MFLCPLAPFNHLAVSRVLSCVVINIPHYANHADDDQDQCSC